MQRHSKRQKKQLQLGFFMLGGTLLALGFYTGLKITEYTFTSDHLPEAFDGFRIAFLSDLHCERFGAEQKKLLTAIDSMEPDLVVFTGDMIDHRHPDLTPMEELLDGLYGKYPVYAVHGNHEFDDPGLYQTLIDIYQRYSVQVLCNESVLLHKSGQTVSLSGISYRNTPTGQELRPDTSAAPFHILLYHDASALPWTGQLGYDIILSGHVHGGVIRLPFIGGLLSPDTTFFPPYDRGEYKLQESTMFASAGLGSTLFPRFFNRPELLLLTLKRGNSL